MAADFELDLLSFAISLYARSCLQQVSRKPFRQLIGLLCDDVGSWVLPRGGGREARGIERKNVHEASFRRHISMNCLISDTSFGMLGEIESERGCVLIMPNSLVGGIFRLENWAVCVGVAAYTLADGNLRHTFDMASFVRCIRPPALTILELEP